MTTPDKCPKCGANIQGEWCSQYDCGTYVDRSKESLFCLMTQRAQRAEALLAATTRDRQILYARLRDCDYSPEQIEEMLLEG